MGLDGSVRCDCWEAGRCTNPPPGLLPYWEHEVDLSPAPLRNGKLSRMLSDEIAMDQWAKTCCKHRDMRQSERIGNAALLAHLRALIQDVGDACLPILSHTFGGDSPAHLASVDALAAKNEAELLITRMHIAEDTPLCQAIDAIGRLLDASNTTGNPIIWC